MKPVFGNKFKVIGVMSGTSLDGLDLAAIEFNLNNNQWDFELVAVETIGYSNIWKGKLSNAPTLSGEKLIKLDIEFGQLIALEVNSFIKKTKFTPELIASHGHTVFHQPENGITLQIGNGFKIASITNKITVADFRTLDVALGGQGAPLVPIGDKLLFSEFDYCLNLGGFSNISYDLNGQRIAFDICPANLVLNYCAEKQDQPFDLNGELGKKGQINLDLLNKLNALSYYTQQAPKSLGREWLDETFLPILNSFDCTESDKIRTIYEHIAIQISLIGTKGKMLVTGGGTYNTFLMEKINFHSDLEIIIPDKQIIEFKEALIFAFLGVLKMLGKTNCLSSVTGAVKDSSTGTVYSA